MSRALFHLLLLSILFLTLLAMIHLFTLSQMRVLEVKLQRIERNITSLEEKQRGILSSLAEAKRPQQILYQAEKIGLNLEKIDLRQAQRGY